MLRDIRAMSCRCQVSRVVGVTAGLAPTFTRDQSGEDGEPDPVGGLVADPGDLAAQHRVLVPQRQHLCVFGRAVAKHTAGTLIRFRTSAVAIDSGIEGSSQVPWRPLPCAEKLQARPGIVFPSGTGQQQQHQCRER
jgi:hypothetical protein